MQFKATIVALALAATSSQVSAQGGISDLPECAVQASVGAIGSTGCDLTDIKCICSNTAFLQSLQPAVAKACSPSDVAKTAQVAQQLCASVGVTLSIPSPAGSSSAAESSPSTAPGPVSVTTTSVATSTVVVGTGTGTGAPAPTTNGTITTATPTASATIVPGAAANVGVQGGLIALAGAAAMFFAL